ncbi:hypothetical protein [Enterovibrio paralichthyis]|uniref:hypothetical protein n=1 Tax=Enterovibrio paralichthyis TaxID=2853805 RepID=UPI001C455DD1|nr:hypothetical protein [Enterovibrio paralichthyis]MBV7300252.1 hypothetical protein [Enterovibrio paralichthyis]
MKAIPITAILFVVISVNANAALPKNKQLEALEIRNPDAAKIASNIIGYHDARCDPMNDKGVRWMLSDSRYFHSLVAVGAYSGHGAFLQEIIDSTLPRIECGNIDAAIPFLNAKLGLTQ